MIRVLLAALGVCASGYGVALLAARPDDLAEVGWWLAGGVVAHDAALAPLVVLAGWVGVAVLPAWARGAAAGGLVVLGSLTLLAVPVLGRFGERPDNPTLLDRDYADGWLLVAGLTAAGILVAAIRAARAPGSAVGEGRDSSGGAAPRAERRGAGQDPGRR